jgi:RNA polymerase sigma factor (sigma-70 family)
VELIAPAAKSGVGNDLALQLQIALDKLHPEVLAIVILHYQEGYTGDEIAAIVGKTRSAVAKILERTREELRERIGIQENQHGIER